MFEQSPGPRSRLEAATALVYTEVSALLDRLQSVQADLARVEAGIAQKTASLAQETDRREAMLSKSIGAMQLTTEREKEGLAIFIEQRANEFVALAADGQVSAMKAASREVFQRDVQASFDKLAAAVAQSRAQSHAQSHVKGSIPSPLMRLVEFLVIGILGGCAGGLMTLLIVDYMRARG